CTHRGWSSPMALSCSLIACSDASGPRIRRAGLPGNTRMKTNATSDAPKTATEAPRILLATTLNMRVPPAGIEDVAGAIGDDVRRRDREEHADAGEDANPPLTGEEVLKPVGDHRAPLRRRHARTEPHEAERREREDRVAEHGGGLDQERRDDVRDDVAQHDAHPTCAERVRRLDERQRADP